VSELLRRPLLRRAADEQRKWVMAIGVLLVLNLVVYLAVIRPSSQRVSSVTERTQTAEGELAAARLAEMRAKAALTGKSDASKKLDTFYHDVLPASFSAARDLFFPWVEQTARQVGLEATSSTVDVMSERDRQLTQFSIQMELAGSYNAVREFIHRLERAPKFVVIDRVTLQENPAEGGLALKLELSTFYRGSAQ
jgi:type II secretory pathway component PulM